MYSMQELLQILHSDGAEALQIEIGAPPALLIEGQPHPIEGPPITAEHAEQLFQALSNSRQRRELWELGSVRFVYRFRGATDFLVQATLTGENLRILVQ